MIWLTVTEYSKRFRISKRHVRRMIHDGKLQGYRPEGGKKWVIAVPAVDEVSSAGREQAHNEVIKELLEWASFDLQPLLDSFPKVYEYSYRPDDPSNSLRWVSERNGPRVEMWFNAEGRPGWQSAVEHLLSGLPATYRAWREVKAAAGEYWRQIADIESDYVRRIELFGADESRVSLDTAHFVRSILADVDRVSSAPTIEDYEITLDRKPVLVRYAGQGIASGEDESTVRMVLRRHLDWRTEFATIHKRGLVRLREGLLAAGRTFVKTADDVLVRGQVPGRCDQCPQTNRDEER